MDDFVELAPFETAILRVFVVATQFARHKVHGHLAVRKSCWFMIWWQSRKSTCQEQTNSSVRNKRIVGQQRGLCKILYIRRLHEHAKLIHRSFFRFRDANAEVYSRKIISENKYFMTLLIRKSSVKTFQVNPKCLCFEFTDRKCLLFQKSFHSWFKWKGVIHHFPDWLKEISS